MSQQNINTGGAFPAGSVRKSRPVHDPGGDFHVTDVLSPAQPGITIRDYFAAKAMQASIAHGGMSFAKEFQALCAHDAYEMADAMLKARDQA